MKRLFFIAALSVIPFWTLIIFLPHWGKTRLILDSLAIVAIPLLVYNFMALPRVRSLVLLLFRKDVFEKYVSAVATPGGAVLMWAHVSAFDLVVGRYIYLDAIQRSLSWWWVGPILFMTMAAGPVGLGAYLLALALI